MICEDCDGEGRRWYEVMRYGGPPGAYSPFEEVFATCETCGGTGEATEDEDHEDV